MIISNHPPEGNSTSESQSPVPWIQTPLLKSPALSRAAGCEIFLKLENLQPSGSFKSRGIGLLMLKALERLNKESGGGEKKIPHFYCSSGGNAGLAAVVAAKGLNCPATIVVPLTTSPLMITKLRTLGAHVIQHGSSWSVADTHLRNELLSNDPTGIYVPPFDHADVWFGHSTMIDELTTQLPSYDAICCSVGGGGLFVGIMDGLLKNQKISEVQVLATETIGAESLHQSVKAGKRVTLDGITSIANSLGAITVCEKAFEWSKLETVKIITVTDAQAAMASVRFADDERILVEVACGASIAAAYNGTLRRVLGPRMSDEEWSKFRVVMVVCGGNNVTLDILMKYREKYAVEAEREIKKQIGEVPSAEENLGALEI